MFSAVELASGLVAGITTTIVAHPLDLIKTRLQLDTSASPRKGRSLLLARSLYYQEGGIVGLYRGLTPNLVGNASSWALYFYTYDAIKTSIRRSRSIDDDTLKARDYLFASGAAGILTTVVTNPIWVVKTRMLSTSSRDKRAYHSILDGVRHIFRDEGWRGFYRGLLPSTVGVSHGAIQFMLYEELKARRVLAHRDPSAGPSNLEFVLYSGASKAVAGSITYPYQVVRSRLQTFEAGESRQGLFDVLSKMWQKERLAGFYKGLVPNLVRIIPSSCVTFLAYENTRALLSTRSH